MSPARVKAWVPHMVCLGLLLGQLGTWLALHRSDAEIESAWRDGATTRERLDALHVLLNRGTLDPSRFGLPFVRELLAEDDDLLKEVAFTNDVCKFLDPEYQKTEYLGGSHLDADIQHFWRSYVIFRRKVGGGVTGAGLRLLRQELAWFYDAVHERPLSIDDILLHMEARWQEIARRQAQ
ncbi:MAG: hypothetical protein E2O39_15215 [Planctomycetota bacterium]|nr:MAG: hypothetical protein E2O39_15215 [Planctomycetota bacterium]